MVRLLDPRARLPVPAHEGGAGAYLVAVEETVIPPGERRDVGTGLALAIPVGYAGFVQPRSGLAFKHCIMVVNSPGLIDSGYRGEVRVSLYNSGSPSFLISEAVRGFGAILTTQDGAEFMHRYDKRGSLAPRDVVALAIDTELKKRGEEYVYLDLRHLAPDEVRERFPHIYRTCLEKYRIDITREPVPVVPAAHYSCGGVVTDIDAQTTIRGLYAAGEVSMTGVHGANRLASNSLLEALVFAERGAASSRAYARSGAVDPGVIPDWDDSGTFNAEEWVLISHTRREIQQIMWDYVGIVRSTLRLERAGRRLELIEREVEAFYKKTKVGRCGRA